MNCRCLIGRLLAVFVIAGLVVAPLAASAAAIGLSSTEIGNMTAMSGDMQCCPDEQQNKNCHDCR